jgi:hypothetical protein
MLETVIEIVLGYGAAVVLLSVALRRAHEPLRSWGSARARS